ncbi:CLUMA_CG016501, isoform A [Clunio marinus]|uniref:Guanosine-3',5'-bis(diphosphate) 3'-pyrophosphohydrolase MESH1 n=1 Tax=Clunio marinus TaxID=568069 RepID=A0A1J1ITY3_9DIPT|nr:CLUMA_CG016501, isoform A [Clunio marinus]
MDQPAWNHETIQLYTKAMDFAAVKHRDQRRKDASETPYINHPIGVANILTSEGKCFDFEVLIAALLHDTVEDTDTTFSEIETLFGEKIANIVKEVTDDKTLPKMTRKELQIEKAKTASTKAKLVKLADKLYNLRDLQRGLPEEWTEERRSQYFIWAKKVVDNLRGTNQMLEDSLDVVFREQKLID